MEFVTFAQAKKHLQVDHADDDVLIAELVTISSAIVVDYLKQSPRTQFESMPTPDPVTGMLPAPPFPYFDQVSSFTYPYPYPGLPPTWWPRAKPSFQNLPPYVLDQWVDTSGQPIFDTSGASSVPGQVQAATKLVIGVLYADREGQTDPISPAVESLLRRFRDPAVA